MRFNADLINEGHNILLVVKYPQEIENGRYTIEVKEVSTNRTRSQENHFWGLVRQISKHEYGDESEVETIYSQLLEMCGVKSEYISIKKEAYDDLKKMVKHTRIVEEDADTYTIQVSFGVSQLSLKELQSLITTTERYCSELGIYMEE